MKGHDMQQIGETVQLGNGAATAAVSTIVARLLSLRVDGEDLTQAVTAGTPHELYNGVVLAPWPNRIRDGRWVLDGRMQQLDITEPARGGALHGLLSFADYRVVGREVDSVTLAAVIPPQHGWPFALETSVRYDLRADGITVTHGAHNRSAVPAPWSVGAHPYLRVGSRPVEQLTVTVPTATVFVVDERLDPVDEVSVDGGPFDLRRGRIVADLDLDTAYRLESMPPRPDGFVVGGVLEAPDGLSTVLLQDRGWDFVQVVTTSRYPSEAGSIGAIALEPMTAPPDSLNSGVGVAWIEPGGRWRGSWGLRRERR